METIVEKGHKIGAWLKKGRMGQWALAALCLAVLVVIYMIFSAGSNAGTKDGAADTPAAANEDSPYADMEDRLERILSSIQGAGDVQVMITYASGTEIVPAMSTDSQSNTSEQNNDDGSWSKNTQENEQSSPIITQSDSDPVVLKEIMPEILGVMVVAEGAGDLHVRMELQQAVETVLQISSKKVDVFPMEKSVKEDQ